MIDQSACVKGFIYNPSNYKCKCDKSKAVVNMVSIYTMKNLKVIDKLVWECTKTNNKVNYAKVTLAENENNYKCIFCTLYIVLFPIAFTNNVGIGTYFVYYKYIYYNAETNRKEKFSFSSDDYQSQFTGLINETSQRNKH